MRILIEAFNEIGHSLAWAEFDSPDGSLDPLDSFRCHSAWYYEITYGAGSAAEVVRVKRGPEQERVRSKGIAGYGKPKLV